MEKNHVNPLQKAFIIGGSAGSIEVLLKVFSGIIPSIQSPLIVVLHRKYSADSSLQEVIAHRAPLPVREVEDKDPIVPGTIFLAPADYHLLVENERQFSLDLSEKINFSRPSLDVSFESAAEIYGTGLTGILLSGANADGTEGLMAIKRAHGVTIAQCPETAPVPYMPQHAILSSVVDYVMSAEEITAYINATAAII